FAAVGRLEQPAAEDRQSAFLFPSGRVVDGEANFPGKGNGLRRSRPRANRQSPRLRAMPGASGGKKLFSTQRDAGPSRGKPRRADIAAGGSDSKRGRAKYWSNAEVDRTLFCGGFDWMSGFAGPRAQAPRIR